MERVAHGLSGTAKVAGNFRRTLTTMRSQQYLAPTQDKGIRRAQSSFYSCLFSWTQGSHVEGGFHVLILPSDTLLEDALRLPFGFLGSNLLSEPQNLHTLLTGYQHSLPLTPPH